MRSHGSRRAIGGHRCPRDGVAYLPTREIRRYEALGTTARDQRGRACFLIGARDVVGVGLDRNVDQGGAAAYRPQGLAGKVESLGATDRNRAILPENMTGKEKKQCRT